MTVKRPLQALAALAVLVSACAQKDPVVAKVGKLNITESEFRAKLSDVAPDYQNYVLTPNGQRQFLDVLVREKLVLAAAADSGIDRAPEFKSEWERIASEEKRKLAQAREYLMIKYWRDALRNKGVLNVADEEVRDQHGKFPNEVHMRHILFATHEEAEAALKRLRGGAAFAALAKESLDAQTAADGGKMAPALFGEVIPELEDVVFKSRVGELLGPVRSKFGYHVLKKESEKPTKLDDVRERIRMILEKRRFDAHLQSLQARFPVEVVDVQFR